MAALVPRALPVASRRLSVNSHPTAINGHAVVDDKIVGRNGYAYLIHGFLTSP